MESIYGEKCRKLIEAKLNCKVLEFTVIGQGAVGEVYKAVVDKPPYAIAIKTAKNKQLMEDECRNIEFIRNKADIKLPSIYFTNEASIEFPFNIIGMEYFDGKNIENKCFKHRPKRHKIAFCEQAVKNIEKLHSVNNGKFGKIDNAIYDNWNDYYKPFSQKVIEFAENEACEGRFIAKVTKIMRKAFDNYDVIFNEPIGEPTLIHGDYWTPNLIADSKTMELIGVVDPFNVMWADKEYELFTMVVGFGKKYGMYEIYKSRNKTTAKCDLKIEFYALFSEVYWFSLTKHYYANFMKYKAKQLAKQMKKFNI